MKQSTEIDHIRTNITRKTTAATIRVPLSENERKPEEQKKRPGQMSKRNVQDNDSVSLKRKWRRMQRKHPLLQRLWVLTMNVRRTNRGKVRIGSSIGRYLNPTPLLMAQRLQEDPTNEKMVKRLRQIKTDLGRQPHRFCVSQNPVRRMGSIKVSMPVLSFTCPATKTEIAESVEQLLDQECCLIQRAGLWWQFLSGTMPLGEGRNDRSAFGMIENLLPSVSSRNLNRPLTRTMTILPTKEAGARHGITRTIRGIREVRDEAIARIHP
jgi:hypothetical protein